MSIPNRGYRTKARVFLMDTRNRKEVGVTRVRIRECRVVVIGVSKM